MSPSMNAIHIAIMQHIKIHPARIFKESALLAKINRPRTNNRFHNASLSKSLNQFNLRTFQICQNRICRINLLNQSIIFQKFSFINSILTMSNIKINLTYTGLFQLFSTIIKSTTSAANVIYNKNVFTW